MTAATARRHQRTYNRIRERAGETAAEMWLSLGGPSDNQINAYVRRVVPTLEGAERSVALLLAGHLSTISLEDTATRFPYRPDLDRSTGEALRGVPPTRVYARPGVDARTALSQGRSLAEAMTLGADRARRLAESDVMLAQRAAAADMLGQDPRVTGYRRTLGGNSCAYCAAASTQLYRRGDLAPLHTSCDCGWTQVYGDKDPALEANRQLLDDLKEQGGPEYWKEKGWGVGDDGQIREMREVPLLGDDGQPLLRADGRQRTQVEFGDPVKPVVRNHQELGPVLVDPKHAYTSAADLGL